MAVGVPGTDSGAGEGETGNVSDNIVFRFFLIPDLFGVVLKELLGTSDVAPRAWTRSGGACVRYWFLIASRRFLRASITAAASKTGGAEAMLVLYVSLASVYDVVRDYTFPRSVLIAVAKESALKS